MSLKYPTIRHLLKEKKRLIAKDYDDLNLFTGREGRGKSKLARKVFRKLDASFNLANIRERIHFDWNPYQTRLASLERGQAILLDEFRGHRRESMKEDRMEVLDEFKENRGLGFHHGIVFNRFSRMDRDLITDRVSHWWHVVRRGLVEVREPTTELSFDAYGEPVEPTRYPLVGVFPFTDTEPPGWAKAYGGMKDERMRDRLARTRIAGPVKPVVPVMGPPGWLLDQVLAESKKPV